MNNLATATIIQTISRELNNQNLWSANQLSNSKTFVSIKNLKPEQIKPLVLSLLKEIQALTILNYQAHQANDYSGRAHTLLSTTEQILSSLFRKNQEYNESEWIELMDTINNIHQNLKEQGMHFRISYLPMNYIVQQVERYIKKNDLSDHLRQYIVSILGWEALQNPSKTYYGSDLKKTITKLKKIVQDKDYVLPFRLPTKDIGEAINNLVQNIEEHQIAYFKIFELATQSQGGKPTAKFKKTTKELIDTIGKEKYRKTSQEIIDIACQQDIKESVFQHDWGPYSTYVYLQDANKSFIKGIVWTMADFSDRDTILKLTTLSEKAYTKMPGIGPAAAAIGNACLYVLGNMRGKDGLGALSRLKLKIKQNNVKKSIDKYLSQGAEKYNVSVEELKEMAVPDFHLKDGAKIISFGDYKLQIFIQQSKVKQQWFKPDDSLMKSVPSAVKKSTTLSNKLKEVRKEVKEIQKVYSAQKQRIDNQFILNRTWDFTAFKKYYLDHGLVSYIAKQLIWIFEKGELKSDAILIENQWYNAQGEILDWIDDTVNVRLWHPVFTTEKNIIAWREKMMDLELKQPIKQAFRELYILTAAEVNTKNYSNRMAAHILKQHQFKTLAILRDWKYALMGAYDDGMDNQIASKYLAEYDITAEYWIDELANDESWNDAGIWLYVSTDQVKFKNANGVMDLADVPPVVFSEVMRDVDLFVGVASVGNDPQWQDNNGERQEQRDYWHNYSFGDLSEIAKTRKTILERLLPRLKKIRDKATIDGKFLRIKGDLRTYKIHIGSGNILMEPNDQYLCIVPSRSADKTTDKLFIPFEGDRGLSIVLSKAFLLADDTKITDTTITSQINRA